MSVSENRWRWSHGATDEVAIVSEEATLTYDDLTADADTIGAALEERAVVLIVAHPSLECVVGYTGFQRHGVVTMMVAPSADIAPLVEAYRPEYIWCPEDHEARGSVVTGYRGWHALRTGHRPEQMPHPELALMLGTSGSTGSSKYVRLSYRNIDASSEVVVNALGIDRTHRAVTTLPLSFAYGLTLVNTHFRTGASLVVTDRSVVERAFWDLVKRSAATTFPGVTHTYQMLHRMRFAEMDVPSLRYLTQAGGPLGVAFHREFAAVCESKGIGFHAMYGQTEAAAQMTSVPPERAFEEAGTIGRALPGGRFTVVDANGIETADPDIPGDLIYYGGGVAMGYATSRADLASGDEWQGRLDTGDVAKFDENGAITLLGRKKRFLKIFGNRVSLDEVEGILRERGFSVACTGRDDLMTIHVESGDVKEAQDIVCATTGFPRSAIRVVPIDELPRNDAGKVLFTKLEED